MTTAYLSLGSNLGDRGHNLRRGLDELSAAGTLRAVSTVYETAPVGVIEQPVFWNAAAALDTDLTPGQLLTRLKKIERDVGRTPTYRWGPRVLDIDILLYDSLITDVPALVIPHPEMQRRAFVLVPLAEIAPEVRHPLLRLSIRDLRDRVEGREAVRALDGVDAI